MSAETPERPPRVLVIDDMVEIHALFRKLLCPRARPTGLAALEASLFGPGDAPRPVVTYAVDSALQGEEGVALARVALAEGRPYAVAFVDMRMPPGWDGVQTIEAMWRVDPDVEVVISTAYSDEPAGDILARVGGSGRATFLHKPFGAGEVRELARALAAKWALRQQARRGVVPG